MESSCVTRKLVEVKAFNKKSTLSTETGQDLMPVMHEGFSENVC